MDWSFLNQPVVQFAGVVTFLFGLQKAGVPVGKIVRDFFGVSQQVDFDNRTVAQDLLNEMQKLSMHFNHETTGELTGIKSSLDKIHDKQDEANELLRGFDKYGLKCRKE